MGVAQTAQWNDVTASNPLYKANAVSLRIPLLRPDQSMIARHPAKIKVVVMGRRWGKTVLGGSIALTCAAKGARVAWIVPTYRNGRALWKWSESLVAPLRAHRLAKINRADRLIEMNSGGFLGVYSADSPDSIRGDAFHIAIVDEAARVTEETWQAVIQPTLADYDGRAFLISTPRGLDWFYKEYLRGREMHNTEQMSWNAPTSGNPNKQIQHAYRRAKSRVAARTFQQEWDAQFVEWEGIVFRLVEDVSTLEPLVAPRADRTYVAGLDWGKQIDFTVLSIFEAETGEQVYLDRYNEIDYELQLTRLVGTCRRFNVKKIIAEKNAMGDPLIERCYRMGLPIEGFQTTNASKALLVDDFSLAMETNGIMLLDHEQQKKEMKAFEGSKLPSGLIRYAAPEGEHDDTVMAGMLAYQALKIPEPAGGFQADEDIPNPYRATRQTPTPYASRGRRKSV